MLFKIGDKVAPIDQEDTPGTVVEVKDIDDGTEGYVISWDDGLEDKEPYTETELVYV